MEKVLLKIKSFKMDSKLSSHKSKVWATIMQQLLEDKYRILSGL